MRWLSSKGEKRKSREENKINKCKNKKKKRTDIKKAPEKNGKRRSLEKK